MFRPYLGKALAALLAMPLLALLPAYANDPAAKPKSTLPTTFDLRSLEAVTPVKQQLGGTCWAHGTMAAIESHLLLSGAWKKWGGQGMPALSEYHLDWWNGFNRFCNEDLEDPSKDPSGLKPHVGGDYRVAAAYLARGAGVVAAPLAADNTVDRSWYTKAPQRLDPKFRRYYVRDIEWFVIGNNLENIDIVKQRLMTEGALGTAYAVGKSFISKDFVHYQPPTSPAKPNHAVAIVGWDDEKVSADPAKQAPKPGAWLIKNSWGTKKGDKGYYWISYYDKHCGRDPEMGAVSFRNVELMKYSHIYLHDYHGWRDTLKSVAKAFNTFTASKRHKIVAVSFYTAADNVRYTATIYQRFENGKLSGERASKSGQIRFTGFHTIDLDAPIVVEKGETFHVYLDLSEGGHPIDRTSEIPVLLNDQPDPKQPAPKQPDGKQPDPKQPPKGQPKPGGIGPGRGPNGPLVISRARPGESFYFDGTTWKDLYEYRFDNPTWATFDRTANFCMKALAMEVEQ